MAVTPASSPQVKYVKSLAKRLSLQCPKAIFESLELASAWLTLADQALTEDERSKQTQKKDRPNEKKIREAAASISTACNINALTDCGQASVRQWLGELSAAAAAQKVPPGIQILRYWQRALLYRDLNAFAEENVAAISVKVNPLKLREEAPLPNPEFKTPTTAKPQDPVALLIAYAPKNPNNDRSRATAFLGIPLAYDANSRTFIPVPSGTAPFFSREWLEPPDPNALKDTYFGCVIDCEEYVSTHPVPTDATWLNYWRYVEDFVGNVAGRNDSLPDIGKLVGRRNTEWKVVNWDSGGASKRIFNTYDEACTTKTPPLLDLVSGGRGASKPDLIDLKTTLQHASSLLGHIDTFDKKEECRVGFSLEKSQRVAATAMTQVKNGHLLTVNGPPGTGKTSFLRAVIGTEYVQSALNGCSPAMILATAATNKAVTNIIESFAEISGPEMQSEWTSRWLPHLPSYGWFYPAKSKQDEDLTGFMVLRKHRDNDDDPWRLVMSVGAEDFESAQIQKRTWMLDAYLELHRQVLELPEKVASPAAAAHMIRQKLAESVKRMNTIQADFRSLIELPRKLPGLKASATYWEALVREEQQRAHRLADSEKELSASLKEWNDTILNLREARRLKESRSGWLYRIGTLLFGDKRGLQAQALEQTALNHILEFDPTFSPIRGGITNFAAEQQSRTSDSLKTTREEWDTAIRATSSAQELLQHWDNWNNAVAHLIELLGDAGDLTSPLDSWASSEFAGDQVEALMLALEDLLDKRFRFKHFHMAARYWEARWLDDIPMPEDVGDIPRALNRVAMLAPVIVSTVYTLPGIFAEFESADLLIFDESGQAAPEIGAASFAYAKRAIVVGDIYQLKPVWNVGKTAETRLKTDLEIDEVPEAMNVASGSVMLLAQDRTSFSDVSVGPLGLGIGLVAHYRCRADIIEYCRRLIYGDGLFPARQERPPKGKKTFLYPPMAWVAVEQKQSAQKKDGSWINQDQIDEVVRWLKHDRQRIIDHYGATRISDVVALIAPFRAQARALEKAVASLIGKEEADAMVINTVHALQGAEKPIVAFTLTQDEGGFFVDRDGPNLLNVAISRAKDCFILFAAPAVLQPTMNAKEAFVSRKNKKIEPLSLLIEYMNKVGKRLYPREVVVIEAPGKIDRIQEALGLSAKVIATGGHFRRVVEKDGGLSTKLLDGGEGAVMALKAATEDLRQIDNFYLATDDDDDGEEIAWHVQEVLRSQGITEEKRILRMRFYSLAPEDIRNARELALPGIDARRVRANMLRAMFDGALHRLLAESGLKATRPQLAIIAEIAARQKESGHWRIKVEGTVSNRDVTAYVVNNDTNAPVLFEREEQADQIVQTLTGAGPAQLNETARCSVLLPRYPAASTAQTLIAGYKRYHWSPKQTSEALNALYLGHTRPKTFSTSSSVELQVTEDTAS